MVNYTTNLMHIHEISIKISIMKEKFKNQTFQTQTGGTGPFSVTCDWPFLKSVICEKAKFNSVICDRDIFCDAQI